MTAPTQTDRKVVVLLSGGLDSTVALYKMLDDGFDVSAISFDYGQRHSRELDAAATIARTLRIRWNVVEIKHRNYPLFKGSSQTDNVPVPHGHYADASMRVTVVPNRNMIMLSIAAAWAISLGCSAVCYAAHAGDHAIYPDCRPEFVHAMSDALQAASYDHKPYLMAPFIGDSKADIVRLGAKLVVPFEHTWSCYEGRTRHCGKCGTCVERREAFQVADVADPTEYTD